MHLGKFYIFILSISSLCSQALPKTNIYSLLLDKSANWKIQKIEFLNSFNFNSYNNQPYFINDDEIFCTVKTENGSSTDIYRLDLNEKNLLNIISNVGNDYSARWHPGNDGSITSVHVPENDTIQYLVRHEPNEYSSYEVLLENPGQVGYYRYYGDKSWVCFLVDQPNNLLAIIGPDSKKIFASSIGRTFEIGSKKEIYFVHKILQEQWMLKTYDPVNEKMNSLIQMPVGAEDFVLSENGEIYCSSGSKILKRNSINNNWESVLDLSEFGIHKIGRFAMRKNRLVLVNEIK